MSSFNPLPYIPSKTRQELTVPAPVGSRHSQIVKVVSSLMGQRLNPDAIFSQLRSMYGPDVSDREIADVIRWASGKSFTPCAPRSTYRQAITAKPSPPPAVNPVASIQKYLGGFTAGEADLWHESP